MGELSECRTQCTSNAAEFVWISIFQHLGLSPISRNAEKAREIDALTRPHPTATRCPVELVNPCLAPCHSERFGKVEGREQKQMIRHQIAEQIVIATAGVLVMFFAIALMMPLVKLLEGLSA